jgi:hypothetical protein
MKMSNQQNETNKKRFNTRLFLLILGLVALGAFLKIPAAIFLEGLVDKPSVWARVSIILFVQDFLIMGFVPAGIGILLKDRLGIMFPLFPDKGNVASATTSKSRLVLNAVGIGIALGAIGLLINWITKPIISENLAASGIDSAAILSASPIAPLWAMSLLSLSAGIVEEVAFRLGILVFLAWLLSLIWKPRGGKLRPGVFWVVNIVLAIVFSLAHFSNLVVAGIPLGLGIVLRTVIGNSLASLVFGWLFWKKGLGSAVLAHSSVDLTVYVIAPFIAQLFV